MTTFLKRLVFDDDRLRERTLTDLVKAFSTGRMVAFVGSMATEAQGYGRWRELVRNYVEAALAIARLSGAEAPTERGRNNVVEGLEGLRDFNDASNIIEARVALSLAREALDQLDQIDPLNFDVGASPGTDASTVDAAAPFVWPLEAGDADQVRAALRSIASEFDYSIPNRLGRTQILDIVAARFFGRRHVATFGPQEQSGPVETPSRKESVVHALFTELRIQRYATLNYDLEIEAELMVEPSDPGAQRDPIGCLLQLRRCETIRRDASVPRRFSRLLADGNFVESDVRDRARPDRLIDFAIGSTTIDRSIMHLHGLASEPPTMVVGLQDYDRLYRKNDPARVPFDHGQRILFAGNPVLFVGTGMTEQEVTWTLQDFVSNNPYRRFATAFLLWGTAEFSCCQKERRVQKWLKRIDFYRRFGVLTVFDEDLMPPQRYRSKDRRSTASRGSAIARSVLPELLRAHSKAWEAVEEPLSAARKEKDPNLRRPLELKILAKSVPLLARACASHDAELRAWGSTWRTLTTRLEGLAEAVRNGTALDRPITLWKTHQIESEIDANFDALFAPKRSPDVPFRTVIATAGSGKGVLAWAVAEAREDKHAFGAPAGRRLIVNAGYALDSDFLLLAITRFIDGLRREEKEWFPALPRPWGKKKAGGRQLSRERRFDKPDAFDLRGWKRQKALVVINGIERFFTVDGAPLSAELDHLLRRIASGPAGDMRWLFLGTPRIERYFRTICAPAVVRFSSICNRSNFAGREAAERQEGESGRESMGSGPYIRHIDDREAGTNPWPKVNSVYFSYVIRQMESVAARRSSARPHALANFGDLVVLEAHKSADPRAISRAVVDAYVTQEALQQVCPKHSDLAMEILRALAFIGNPVEAAVLLHVPRVRQILSASDPKRRELLLQVIADLVATGLVIAFERLDKYPEEDEWVRYGLHTAVAAAFRKRVGVPLTESKLSTSFNMSLYAAQPADSFVPDRDIGDELGHLVDHLIGAYKDDATGKPIDASDPDPQDKQTDAAEENRKKDNELRSGPHAAAAMRAALALIRSYYSTTNLLTLECDQQPLREDRNGVLLEHAERLESLLGAYRKLRRARDEASREDAGAGSSDRGKEAAAAVEVRRGPDPLFAEDLVWLLNELGVVYLAQGDLYSARSSLQEALRVNRDFVEHNCRSHNWRRMTMNSVFLEIERGDLGAAEHRLREIESAIGERNGEPGKVDPTRFATMRREFGQDASNHGECFDSRFMHEDVLMTGLVLGHRAFVCHLRGYLRTAGPLYIEALAILRRLGEHRAYAMFQRLYGQLLNLSDREASQAEIRIAVAASESVRQMDMAYHARSVSAHEAWQADRGNAVARRRSIDQLNRALAYAATMDLYRLRVEAGLYLARLKLDSGDHDSALEHAADALSVAARYGLSLRKISLRIEIGHILLRRGDTEAGAALIAHAAEAADAFGYQRAVEAAHQIRLAEGIAT